MKICDTLRVKNVYTEFLCETDERQRTTSAALKQWAIVVVQFVLWMFPLFNSRIYMLVVFRITIRHYCFVMHPLFVNDEKLVVLLLITISISLHFGQIYSQMSYRII